MRLHCIFPSKLPIGASLEYTKGKEVDAGGKSMVLLKVTKNEGSRVISSILNTLKWVTQKKNLVQSQIIRTGGGEPSQKWNVVWCQEAEDDINTIILLSGTISDEEQELHVTKAAENAIRPLTSTDIDSIRLVLVGILSTKTNVCIASDSNPSYEQTIWDRMGDRIIEMIQELISQDKSWLGRIMLASFSPAIGWEKCESLQRIIVSNAPRDTAKLLDHTTFLKNIDTNMYNQLPNTAWLETTQARRLVMALMLCTNTILASASSQPSAQELPSLLQMPAEDVAGEESARQRAYREAVKRLLDDHKDAFDLVEKLDMKVRRYFESDWRVTDPSSSMVAAMYLARHEDKPVMQRRDNAPRFMFVWRGPALMLATCGCMVHKRLETEYQWSYADKFRQLFERDVLCSIIRDLSLLQAVAQLDGFITAQSVCQQAVELWWDKHKGASTSDLCKAFEADVQHLSSVLPDVILNFKIMRTDSSSHVNAIILVKLICSNTPAEGHEALRTVLSLARRELVEQFIQPCDLHKVLPEKVDWTLHSRLGKKERELALYLQVSSGIAEHWMRTCSSISAFCRALMDRYFERLDDFMSIKDNAEEVQVFCSICRYAGELPESLNTSSTPILARLQLLSKWAKWTTSAAKDMDPVRMLRNALDRHKEEIPVAFLRYLASNQREDLAANSTGMTSSSYATRLQTQRSQGLCTAREYLALLLGGTNPAKLSPFLPATEEAKSQSEVLDKLRKWLSSLNVEKNEELEKSMAAFEEKLKAASLPTFPACLGNMHSDASLSEAMEAFRDDAALSDLVKLKARSIVRQSAQNQSSKPITILLRAREEAAVFMRAVFAGDIMHEDVRVFRRSAVASNLDMKREAAALRDLLSCTAQDKMRANHGAGQKTSWTANDAFVTYLRLVHAEPSTVVALARRLHEFFETTLKFEAPKKLKVFLQAYEVLDTGRLPVFGSNIDYANIVTMPLPSSEKRSVHLLMHEFEEVLNGCDEHAWDQIALLSEMSSLIEYFKGDSGEAVHTLAQLDNKMNMLRIMCVANRTLSRPVSALDCLAPYILKIANARDAQAVPCIAELLRSGVLRKAKNLLDATDDAAGDAGVYGAASSSSCLTQLVHLFRLTESAKNIANRNFDVLKASKLVINVKDLRAVSCGADPFAQIHPADIVSIECSPTEPFQLAGGRTSTMLVREDIDALFVETLVQLSVAQEGDKVEQSSAGSIHGSSSMASDKMLDKIAKVQARLKMVFQLAEYYHHCARLGRLEVPADFQMRDVMDFPTQTPEAQRSIFDDDASMLSETYDIDQRIAHLMNRRMPWVLMDELDHAKRKLTWLSFCPKRDVMQRVETPWISMLASMAYAATSAASRQEPDAASTSIQLANETLRWSTECMQKSRVRAAHTGYNSRKSAGQQGMALSSCVAIALTEESEMMTRVISLLSALGEWPCPSPTAIFPCDQSTVPDAVHELAWRLETASRILESESPSMRPQAAGSAAGSSLTAKRTQEGARSQIQAVFLCAGIVITRPDLLVSSLQDALILALNRYAQATAAVPHAGCPKIVLLMPNQIRADNRFYHKVHDMADVCAIDAKMLAELDKKLKPHKCTREVTVVGSPLTNIASGVRPHDVDEDAYRIRLGTDLSVQDLVAAIRTAQRRNICIDVGGDAACAAKGPLCAAMVSLFACGVIGQAQHAAEAVQGSIFVELAAESAEEIAAKLPVFAWLEPTKRAIAHSKGSKKISDGMHVVDEGDNQAFEQLVQNAGQVSVTDEHVMEALRAFFGGSSAAVPCERLQMDKDSEIPFVHNARSLRTMAAVASRVKAFISRKSSAPVLLSGDTGTGKTYLLIKFLELLRKSGALHKSVDVGFLRIYTLSAAFRREHIVALGADIRTDIFNRTRRSKGTGHDKLYPVVLDEITSSSAQEALTRLICFREGLDGVLKDTRLQHTIILATCNPEPKRDSVFALSPELQSAAILVEPLTSQDERVRFIESQLQDLVRGPGLMDCELHQAKKLILASEMAIEGVDATRRLGTVSLRDSVRCASLVKRLGFGWGTLDGKKVSFFDALNDLKPAGGWAVKSESLRLVLLSCYVCYGMRVLPRTDFFDKIDQIGDAKMLERGSAKRFIQQVKDLLVCALRMPNTVVKTTALVSVCMRECLVCLRMCIIRTCTHSCLMLLQMFYAKYV
jgi:hypothetical protein